MNWEGEMLPVPTGVVEFTCLVGDITDDETLPLVEVEGMTTTSEEAIPCVELEISSLEADGMAVLRLARCEVLAVLESAVLVGGMITAPNEPRERDVVDVVLEMSDVGADNKVNSSAVLVLHELMTVCVVVIEDVTCALDRVDELQVVHGVLEWPDAGADNELLLLVMLGSEVVVPFSGVVRLMVHWILIASAVVKATMLTP